MAAANLLNIEKVSKSFGRAPLLDEVSLGVQVGDRIGVVGRNGGGKSTLLKVMTGLEPADSGRVTVGNDVRIGVLSQAAVIDSSQIVRDFLVGDRPEHDWMSDRRTRECLHALLGGFEEVRLDRPISELSGGERRRVELAALLMQELDLLILDEPTNHLDVEAVAWLASHLKARRDLALVVVTHDRWFLDEVSDRTWEVVGGKIEEYDGGYSAYVLAKAERQRQASTELARRNNLIRKELAWLRRGAPARTTKPKFRIDAANELIEAEPPPRNSVELLSFAGARLGKKVFEAEDVSLSFGDRAILSHLEWNIGPGDRIALVGVNGAGKTTLLKVLLKEQPVDSGRVETGTTVKPAYLSQHVEELNPAWRVLEAIEQIANRVELGKGYELTASSLAERLGFASDAQWTPVGDLSGGERRRLQLARLLMGGPNVLILDEPTNDFDVETLAALEDLLDSFGGTLIVVSHDRYFLERVCDSVYGLMGDGRVRHLPRGIDEYLEIRGVPGSTSAAGNGSGTNAGSRQGGNAPRPKVDQGQLRAAKKDVARLERIISKCMTKERDLHAQIAAQSTDHEHVMELNAKLAKVAADQHEAEREWLVAAEKVESAS